MSADATAPASTKRKLRALPRPGRTIPRWAPGQVRVRLSGERGDVAVLVNVLVSLDWDGWIELTELSVPYPNRRRDGERVYVTVRMACRGGR